MTQEALKLALEALEGMQNAIYNINGEHVIDLNYAVEKADVAEQAISAIKEALAQTQEPVQARTVHITWNADGIRTVNGVPDYTPPPQRTEQNFCSRCGKRTADLTVIHTCTPPQENT